MATPKKKPAPEANLIRSRIVGQKDVDPSTLLANPLNFRRHPKHQMDALRGSMNELGWIKGVIVNRATGNIIDGHARVEEALSQKLKTIPVSFVDLSVEEERLALAVLDPITELAVRDQTTLDELLGSIEAHDAELNALLAGMLSAEIAPPPTLDELDAQHGAPDEETFWPEVKLKVPSDVKERFDSMMKSADGETQWEKFQWLLERVDLAL